MSLSRKNSVPQLVRKYRAKYPQLDRPILRKLIRLENPGLLSREKAQNWDSNLRKLDRHLRKTFTKAQPKTERNPEPSKEQKEKKELFSNTLQTLAGYNEPTYFRRLPNGSKPIYVPQVKPRHISDRIANPDEIQADQSEKEDK